MASAVRCPNSASNTDASASRRPARRLLTCSSLLVPRRARDPSGSDAIDQDGDATELHAQQALHRGADRRPDLGREGDEPLAGAGDEPDGDVDPSVPHPDADRVAGERVTPRGAAAPDAEDPRHLEGGEPHRVADDAGTDGQGGHQVASVATASSAVLAASWRTPAAIASPIRSATRSRAVVAPTRTACSIMRRFARPWVMITAPRTPRSGDPPTAS